MPLSFYQIKTISTIFLGRLIPSLCNRQWGFKKKKNSTQEKKEKNLLSIANVSGIARQAGIRYTTINKTKPWHQQSSSSGENSH